jgi:hypothetical protein
MQIAAFKPDLVVTEKVSPAQQSYRVLQTKKVEETSPARGLWEQFQNQVVCPLLSSGRSRSFRL